MDTQPTDSELIEILEAALAVEDRDAPKQHRDMTADCPPLSRFATAATTGWTAAEEAHRATCRYCQLTWRAVSERLSETANPLAFGASCKLASVPAESAPTVLAFGIDRTFSLAAGASCASAAGESDEIPLEGGWKLRHFPMPESDELMTLQLDGNPIPKQGLVQLCVADEPLPLVEPFDRYGCATATRQVVETLVANRDRIKLRLPEVSGR